MGCYHVPCQLGFRELRSPTPGLDGEIAGILGLSIAPDAVRVNDGSRGDRDWT